MYSDLAAHDTNYNRRSPIRLPHQRGAIHLTIGAWELFAWIRVEAPASADYRPVSDIERREIVGPMLIVVSDCPIDLRPASRPALRADRRVDHFANVTDAGRCGFWGRP